MGTNKIYVIILLLILTNLVSNCNRINKDKCTTEKIITRYGNFQAYRSLEDGIRIANECKKEILLIFSCYSCYSAKDLEWAQLSNTRIKEILDKKYVIIWLPVDEHSILKDTSLTSILTKKKIKTLGEKFRDLQYRLSGTDFRPFYIKVDASLRPSSKSLPSQFTEKQVLDFLK